MVLHSTFDLPCKRNHGQSPYIFHYFRRYLRVCGADASFAAYQPLGSHPGSLDNAVMVVVVRPSLSRGLKCLGVQLKESKPGQNYLNRSCPFFATFFAGEPSTEDRLYERAEGKIGV